MKTFIPLNESYLCCDCNAVGNCSRACPACASTAVFGLFRFIPVHRDSAHLHTPESPAKPSAVVFLRPLNLSCVVRQKR